MLRLPVSRLAVTVRLPTGVEDILLLEASRLDVTLALDLLQRVVSRCDGEPIGWHDLTVTDIDVALMRLRQRALGDIIRAELSCPAPDCRARVDIVFSIDAFLEHHEPKPPPRVEAVGDAWVRLTGTEVDFRSPNAGDQIAIALDDDPELALVRRCVRAEKVPARLRERIETAMELLAPSLFAELEGACPECNARVAADFDPLQYTLRELRNRAVRVYDDVCIIARQTHWREADILALPTLRRTRYAELVQDPGSA